MGLADSFLSSLLGGVTGGATGGGKSASLTDDPALDAFSRTASENSIYNQIAKPLLGAKFNTSTWSPTESAAVSLGQAFLGGLLGKLGRDDVASQYESAASILPDLYRNPSSISLPEGLDSEAFGALKLSALRENAKRDRQLQDSVIASVFTKDPRLSVLAPDTANRIGLGELAAALNQPQEPVSPTVTRAAEVGVLSGLADPTRESSVEKFKRITSDLISAGVPKEQAAVTAREQIAGEVKANASSFDAAKVARETANTIRGVADTAEAGISQLGQTGGFAQGNRAYDWIASNLGSEDANKRRTGRELLESIKPDIIKMSRTAGAGAMSDIEMKNYLSAGPSEDKSTETNYALIQKMKNVASINEDYADFIEAYKAANDGNIAGADRKWNDYKRTFPMFDKSGSEFVLNTNRPKWQDYFSGKVNPEDYKGSMSKDVIGDTQSSSGGGLPSVGNMFNGKKVLSVRKIK
jgi:hypothetical protein